MEKNLGHATAYGYAKSKGYSGTEEEFAELMADYASVGQSAAQSAEQAAASATSASASAQTASQAAQSATSKASEAVTAADTATTKASEASQSASTASAAATSAGTSAQTATTAATTATTKASEASESATTATTAKTDAETARDAAAQSASQAAASAESIDPDEFDRKIYAAFATDTASGPIAHFEDGADSIPMKDVLIHIEPVQEGSGDPSPDNVRPITGWTVAEVTRTGKNLCMPSLYSISGTEIIPNKCTVTIDEDEYVITPSGTNEDVSFGSLAFSDGVVPDLTGNTLVKEGKTYTATVLDAESKFGNNNNFIQFMDKDNKVVRHENNPYIRFGKTVTFTVPQGVKYIGFRIGSKSLSAGNTYKVKIQLELGSTATDYEPYSGQTYSITFPTEAGTVYGGTLDVTTGDLTVTHGYIPNLGSIEWTQRPGTPAVFYSLLLDAAIPFGETVTKSNALKSGPVTRDWGVVLGYGDNTVTIKDSGMPYIGVVDSTCADITQLEAKLNGVQLVYKLATPITYTLTPQEITSLLGTNNVWADTGDCEVEYRASTKMYIDKKITEAVSALS